MPLVALDEDVAARYQRRMVMTHGPWRVPLKTARVVPVLLVATGCGPLVDSPGFNHGGITVKCIHALPAGAQSNVERSAKLAIDVLESDPFKQRAALVLAAPNVRHGLMEKDDVRALDAGGMLDRIERAGVAGFSIKTRWTCSSRTNAWDGYDDPACGRFVLLSRSKVVDRPAYLWAGTVIHELSHVAGFFHDGQQREGNECTVPNLVGDLAEWTAWERTRPAADGEDPFTTWETVCSALAAVCTADPHHRCRIGARGVTAGP
jgi:hypothetical protein